MHLSQSIIRWLVHNNRSSWNPIPWPLACPLWSMGKGYIWRPWSTPSSSPTSLPMLPGEGECGGCDRLTRQCGFHCWVLRHWTALPMLTEDAEHLQTDRVIEGQVVQHSPVFLWSAINWYIFNLHKKLKQLGTAGRIFEHQGQSVINGYFWSQEVDLSLAVAYADIFSGLVFLNYFRILRPFF